MTHSIGMRPWMTLPATGAVMDALEAKGGPGCARFVGGCVRDTVLGREVGDIDIATMLSPQAVTEALEAARRREVRPVEPEVVGEGRDARIVLPDELP